ncbi:XRE family transcriptional regulator [Rhizobium sp. SSA_523]|uniref:helix-turn-helix domain-containing protein n=1 Tax=Rhizobium sp. SSA_523 TaxID=2952477 RepID=UPI0020905A39|nr:XRE family transcriptional regulator [Rhizobium sp. SSA_523]MCO5732767.1 XRE family transcriptional regulator [Rhizobium sp. SSA_523]WKC23615.1 XRE family transcriptional regulator [Rhizobium sp. SSA_523]
MDQSEQQFEGALGDRLKSIRSERGFTLDQLATASGVSRAMISRVERGEASPTAALLARLCEALGLSLSAFFDTSEAERSPLSRRSQQRLWRDPLSGYRRRSISPPGTSSRIDIVEVEFPPAARVSFPPREESRSMTQHIWVFDGVLEMILPDQTYRLEAGDCLFMSIGDAFQFHNPSDRPVRYAVVLDRGR